MEGAERLIDAERGGRAPPQAIELRVLASQHLSRFGLLDESLSVADQAYQNLVDLRVVEPCLGARVTLERATALERVSRNAAALTVLEEATRYHACHDLSLSFALLRLRTRIDLSAGNFWSAGAHGGELRRMAERSSVDRASMLVKADALILELAVKAGDRDAESAAFREILRHYRVTQSPTAEVVEDFANASLVMARALILRDDGREALSRLDLVRRHLSGSESGTTCSGELRDIDRLERYRLSSIVSGVDALRAVLISRERGGLRRAIDILRRVFMNTHCEFRAVKGLLRYSGRQLDRLRMHEDVLHTILEEHSDSRELLELALRVSLQRRGGERIDIEEGASSLEVEFSRDATRRWLDGIESTIRANCHTSTCQSVLVDINYLHPVAGVANAPLYHAVVCELGGIGPSRVRLRLARLGRAAGVDRAVRWLTNAVSNPGLDPELSRRALFDMIIRPILSTADTSGGTELVILTDGTLDGVPLAVLHGGGRDLLDAVRLRHLTSFSQLDVTGRGVGRALLVGDPRLGADMQAFARLPGAREEVRSIASILAGQPLRLVVGLDRDATELFFRERATDSQIIHVASHGSYGPGPCRVRGRQSYETHSSLLLGSTSGTDGCLTDSEVAGMDLRRTEMVVLAACGSGRGEAHPGQGLDGFRHAFFAAGVRTLVTSAWDVDDQSSALLMREFYRRLMRGDDRHEALYGAMRELRSRRSHPYYWASYSILGGVGPLRIEAQ